MDNFTGRIKNILAFGNKFHTTSRLCYDRVSQGFSRHQSRDNLNHDFLHATRHWQAASVWYMVCTFNSSRWSRSQMHRVPTDSSCRRRPASAYVHVDLRVPVQCFCMQRAVACMHAKSGTADGATGVEVDRAPRAYSKGTTRRSSIIYSRWRCACRVFELRTSTVDWKAPAFLSRMRAT